MNPNKEYTLKDIETTTEMMKREQETITTTEEETTTEMFERKEIFSTNVEDKTATTTERMSGPHGEKSVKRIPSSLKTMNLVFLDSNSDENLDYTDDMINEKIYDTTEFSVIISDSEVKKDHLIGAEIDKLGMKDEISRILTENHNTEVENITENYNIKQHHDEHHILPEILAVLR